MKKILEIDEKELNLIIRNTADKLNISSAIVEKDLWVCVILKYLFSDFEYKDYIVFKGGTSLSKVYKLIERFSEDIDLALDWQVLGYSLDEVYSNRSNRKQEMFNDEVNNKTVDFLKGKMLNNLNDYFKKVLGNRTFKFYVDEFDKQTICFDYPKMYSDPSILQVIRLEIGSLAEPIPSNKYKIKTYIEEAYPYIFDENINVIAVESIRTFYEKITILHREANRTNGNYPTRYSRHFYDVYKMLQTPIREYGLKNIDLLKKVIDFKKKFYTCNWAKYDEIMLGKLRLIPSEEAINVFAKDYDSMQNMLFGEKVSFETITNTLKEYEKDMNRVLLNVKDSE